MHIRLCMYTKKPSCNFFLNEIMDAKIFNYQHKMSLR